MAIKFSGNNINKDNAQEECLVNGQPIGGKKKKKFSTDKLLLTFTIIPAVVMMLCSLLPVSAFFFGFLYFAFIMVAIVLPTVATIGLIWFSEEFKTFSQSTLEFFGQIFENSVTDVILQIVSNIYLYVLIIGAILIVSSLIYFIVRKVKNKENGDLTGYLLGTIFCLFLFAVTSVITGAFALSL